MEIKSEDTNNEVYTVDRLILEINIRKYPLLWVSGYRSQYTNISSSPEEIDDLCITENTLTANALSKELFTLKFRMQFFNGLNFVQEESSVSYSKEDTNILEFHTFKVISTSFKIVRKESRIYCGIFTDLRKGMNDVCIAQSFTGFGRDTFNTFLSAYINECYSGKKPELILKSIVQIVQRTWVSNYAESALKYIF